MNENPTNYYAIHMGQANVHTSFALSHNLICLGWSEPQTDLTDFTDLGRKEFDERFIPIVRELFAPGARSSAGNIAGQLYRFACELQIGDVVLAFDSANDTIHFAKVEGDYRYDTTLLDECNFTHRRNVTWLKSVPLSQVSDALKATAKCQLSFFSLNQHEAEIETLLGSSLTLASDLPKDLESLEDFGLESFLEDFIVHNWNGLEIAKDYEIYQEAGQTVGKQYVTEVGRIDILAKARQGAGWLVIELKKGRSGDAVVGQLLRYMGYVKNNLAAKDEPIKGLIITGQDDRRISYAISQVKNVDFMTYKASFKLEKHTL